MHNNNIYKIQETFEVNIDGNVIDKESHLSLPQYISTNGITFTLLPVENSLRKLPVRTDILVLETFDECKPDKFCLPFHIDNDGLNNNLSNLIWVEESEKWLTLYEYDGLEFVEHYEVSSYGNIRRCTSVGPIMLTQYQNKGYMYVKLNSTCGPKIIPVHRLVCYMFWTHDIERNIVNHIDGFKHNNFYTNLEWVTKKENEQHAANIGLMHNNTKLTDNEIIIIQQTLISYDGRVQKTFDMLISTIPNLTVYDVKGIKQRMSYPFFPKLHNKIDDETREIIEDTLKNLNGSPSKTLQKLKEHNIDNISEDDICRIKNKMTYDFPKLNKEPMTEIELSFIRDTLIEENGIPLKTYEKVHEVFERITIKDIQTVKIKMKREGYTFINAKTNRKISDELRDELISLLKENNMSPSKTYSVIQNKGYDVTIYDLKYIKRKYLK